MKMNTPLNDLLSPSPVQSVVQPNTIQNGESGFPDFIEGVDIELGLQRVLGKKSRYLNMLRKFVDLHENTAADIRQALADGDNGTALRLAHTVKGVAGNIGSCQLESDAKRVEILLRTSVSGQEINDSLNGLEKSLHLLVAELKSKLPPVEPLQTVTVDPLVLAPMCDKLAYLLLMNDCEAAALAESSADILSTAFAAEYPGIRAEIELFNFASARTLLLQALQRADLQTRSAAIPVPEYPSGTDTV